MKVRGRLFPSELISLAHTNWRRETGCDSEILIHNVRAGGLSAALQLHRVGGID